MGGLFLIPALANAAYRASRAASLGWEFAAVTGRVERGADPGVYFSRRR